MHWQPSFATIAPTTSPSRRMSHEEYYRHRTPRTVWHRATIPETSTSVTWRVRYMRSRHRTPHVLKMCSRNIRIPVVLFFVLVPFVATLPHSNHNLSKRSNFFELECKGISNKAMFYRLERICEDCYHLFRETAIHYYCKRNCFTHQTFGECLKVLLISDEEVSKLQYFLKVINGSPIPFDIPLLK